MGDTKSIPINVRVLAATNEVLGEKIKGGNFREDLYYRLAVIPIEMPALRERPDDIPLLVSHFLQKNAAQTGTEPKKIDPKARRNARALSLAGQRPRTGKRRRARLRPVRRRHRSARPTCRRRSSATPARRRVEHTGTLPVGQTLDEYIREQERRYIEETIKFNGNSREKAAKMLGISMATLYRKLEVKSPARRGSEQRRVAVGS